MRTNVEIDDSLMDSVLASGHYKTKKDAVEAGLKLLKHTIANKELLKLRGKISFFDDVDEVSDMYPKYISDPTEILKVAEE